ncbi:MAG: hypothetical protein KKH61_21635 [Gammaproteobacteria bacterium]|nr:hypothetical protein [Gammaproteobacteria bacterium]
MKYLLLLGLSMMLTGCGIIKGHSNPMINAGIKVIDKTMPEDGYIEERIEDVIESTVGLETDLSPATPDPDINV